MIGWTRIRVALLGLLSPRHIKNNRLEKELQKILKRDLSASEQEETNSEALYKFLLKLRRAIASLDRNDYSIRPISMDTWLDGVGYVEMARTLALHLRENGWLIHEEIATALWAEAALQVQNHHPHVVGPAMIAWGNCHERLGNKCRAAQIYAAVIADFSWIAEKWKNNVALPQTSVSALHCLKVALQKMLTIKTQDGNSAQLTTLLSKIKRIEMG
jgi:hypothetical protein